MQGLIATIFLMTSASDSTIAEQTPGYIGQAQEIVITALRYENEDDAWSGLMDTIVVDAARYHADDVDSD